MVSSRIRTALFAGVVGGMVPFTPAFGAKVKVAVGSFENKSRVAHREVQAFTDMITTALVKTRKFEVLERERVDDLLREQGMGEMGLMDPRTAQRLGGLTGADVILLGTLTEAGVESKGIGSRRFSITTTTAYLTVDIRILDAETGSIRIAETVSVRKEGGSALRSSKVSFGGGDSGIFGHVAREAAQEVVNLTAQTIFPVKVVSISGDGLILNYGRGTIKTGELYEVFSQGEVIKDPDTGEVLGRSETKAGRIEITSTESKFSKAAIVDGGDAIQEGMVCRKVKSTGKHRRSGKRKGLADLIPW